MAARLVLLLLLVSLAAAAATSNTWDNMQEERSEEEMRWIFMHWTAEHGKAYASAAEEDDAYAMFKHRLRLIDRQWHDTGYSAWSWDIERSEEETRRIFVEWKARHDKIYSSITHEEHRYAMFQDALRSVDRHNAGYAIGVHSGTHGISQFSDLTMGEYGAVCCGFSLERPSPAELERVRGVQERLRLVYAPPSLWSR
ncbi:hypothetical protein ACQ4PT_011174 [Festuca glaucescens]